MRRPEAIDGYNDGQQLPLTPSPQPSPLLGPLSPQRPRSPSYAPLNAEKFVSNEGKDKDISTSHQRSPTPSTSMPIANESPKTGRTKGGHAKKTKAINAPAKAVASGGKGKRKASSDEIPSTNDEQKQKKRLKK